MHPIHVSKNIFNNSMELYMKTFNTTYIMRDDPFKYLSQRPQPSVPVDKWVKLFELLAAII